MLIHQETKLNLKLGDGGMETARVYKIKHRKHHRSDCQER